MAATIDGRPHPFDRRFAIRSVGKVFHAGVAADGRQILIGRIPGQVACFLFDAQGRQFTFESEYCSFWKAGSVLRRWQATLGFVPGTIEVNYFQMPAQMLGIEDLELWLDELGPNVPAADAARLRQLASEGGFALLWEPHVFLLSAGGEVLQRLSP